MGEPKSPEHRAKLSAAQKGRVFTPEHRAKLSAAKKGQPLSQALREAIAGRPSPMKGRKHSAESRLAMSDAKRARMRLPSDEVLASWIASGDTVSAAALKIGCDRNWLARYLQERGIEHDRRSMGPLKPRKRNHRTVAFRILGLAAICQDCGRSKGKILVHHLDHNPLHNHPSNLRVLCNSCHMKHHPENKGRFS